VPAGRVHVGVPVRLDDAALRQEPVRREAGSRNHAEIRRHVVKLRADVANVGDHVTFVHHLSTAHVLLLGQEAHLQRGGLRIAGAQRYLDRFWRRPPTSVAAGLTRGVPRAIRAAPQAVTRVRQHLLRRRGSRRGTDYVRTATSRQGHSIAPPCGGTLGPVGMQNATPFVRMA
jgi:hypothetical protein